MRQNKKSCAQVSGLRILIWPISILLLLSLACNIPEGLPIPTPAGPGAHVYTSVAETLVVLELVQPQDGTDTGPSGTQTPQDSNPSVADGTSQFAPDAVTIYMSENTNCRIGQSTSFERVTILMKDEQVEVVGVDPSGDYYYVRRPDKFSEFCWLWNAYATPSGSIDSLPVFTPVPTATSTEDPG